jgi:heat shock protein HslJ
MAKRFSRLFAAVALTACGTGVVAGGPELGGTTWKLMQLGPNGAVDEAPATLSFSKDGKVTGNGGCNSFEGTYTVSGMVLKFGALTAGKKVCGEAANKQEASLLKALEQAQTYQLGATKLSINTKMWNEPISFVHPE